MEREYVEHGGVLFKLASEGEYLPTVFCPVCKRPMSALADMLHFYCPHCNRRSDFTSEQLGAIMKTLPTAECSNAQDSGSQSRHMISIAPRN